MIAPVVIVARDRFAPEYPPVDRKRLRTVTLGRAVVAVKMGGACRGRNPDNRVLPATVAARCSSPLTTRPARRGRRQPGDTCALARAPAAARQRRPRRRPPR